jgi:hypothetical protein
MAHRERYRPTSSSTAQAYVNIDANFRTPFFLRGLCFEVITTTLYNKASFFLKKKKMKMWNHLFYSRPQRDCQKLAGCNSSTCCCCIILGRIVERMYRPRSSALDENFKVGAFAITKLHSFVDTDHIVLNGSIDCSKLERFFFFVQC